MRKTLIFMGMLTGAGIMAGNLPMNPTEPDGGICFRMDDNHTPEQWRDIAAVFNRHQMKFSASLNIGVMTPAMIEQTRRMQREGHEIMDHTPRHNPMIFQIAPGQTAGDYRNRPGVDHVSDNTVCLKYVEPRVRDDRKLRRCRLEQDRLELLDPPDARTARQLGAAAVAYIPAERRCFQLTATKKPNEFQLKSVWGEKNVREPAREVRVDFLRDLSFPITPEALELLGRHSLELFARAGLSRPLTWIQPGGGVSCISAADARRILGDRLGYQSAATYVGQARKVFREYDPQGTAAFGMMWGDFDEENRDLAWNQARIADLVALHHVAISHSHMRPKDGWDNYLQRLDRLLAWCAEQQIPIHTQAEWTQHLYRTQAGTAPDNVFPALATDRDGNGVPDGCQLKNGVWDRNRAMIVSDKPGESFAVRNLGGLVRGGNRLSFTADAAAEGSLKVTVLFPGTRHPQQEKTFAWSAAGKHPCAWDLTIPADASIADFCWQSPNGGKTGVTEPTLRPQPKSTGVEP